MRKPQVIDSLTDLGLSANEALVYQAALASGPTTVLNIAKTAGIKRTTVYSVVEDLMKSGLMTIEMNGFKKLYSPASPDKLENILERRKQDFQKLLPELSAMYNLKGGESFIKYYSGLSAVKDVYNSLLTETKYGESYDVISNTSQWYAADPEFFGDFIVRRTKQGIHTRLLLQDTTVAHGEQKVAKQQLRTIKLLPKGAIFDVNLVITASKLIVHQQVEPVLAIVIETKSVIHLHKMMFELIWNSIPETD